MGHTLCPVQMDDEGQRRMNKNKSCSLTRQQQQQFLGPMQDVCVHQTWLHHANMIRCGQCSAKLSNDVV